MVKYLWIIIPMLIAAVLGVMFFWPSDSPEKQIYAQVCNLGIVLNKKSEDSALNLNLQAIGRVKNLKQIFVPEGTVLLKVDDNFRKHSMDIAIAEVAPYVLRGEQRFKTFEIVFDQISIDVLPNDQATFAAIGYVQANYEQSAENYSGSFDINGTLRYEDGAWKFVNLMVQNAISR